MLIVYSTRERQLKTFHKSEDNGAFTRIMAEGLEGYQVEFDANAPAGITPAMPK